MRRWFGGRLLLDWSQPAKLVRYLGTGARRWAWAGMYSLVWGKLASRIPALRRLAYRRFGPEPTTAVQRRPQMVARTHRATADETLLHEIGAGGATYSSACGGGQGRSAEKPAFLL